jgi:hypothetical protein
MPVSANLSYMPSYMSSNFSYRHQSFLLLSNLTVFPRKLHLYSYDRNIASGVSRVPNELLVVPFLRWVFFQRIKCCCAGVPSMSEFSSTSPSAHDRGSRRVVRLRIAASKCASIPTIGEFMPLCFTLNFYPGFIWLNIVSMLISLASKLYFLHIFSPLFHMHP